MHIHYEVIAPLPGPEPDAFELTAQEACDQAWPEGWEIGGRFRGAHEPGGPHPDRDIEEFEAGGLPVRMTRGLPRELALSVSRLALPADLIAMSDPAAREFLAREDHQAEFAQLRDGRLAEISREEAAALLGRRDLVLVTIDAHV